MIKQIPIALKNQPKNAANIPYQIAPLNALKEGLNIGLILTCKVTTIISNKEDVPW